MIVDRVTSAMLDAVDALIAILDAEGRVLVVSRGCQQTSGLGPGELKGKYFWDLPSISDEAAAVKSAFQAVRTGKNQSSFEAHWRSKRGFKRLVRWTIKSIVDESGHLDCVVVTGIDTTDVLRHQEGFRGGESRLAGIIGSAMDAIVSVNEQQRITLFNAAAELMFRCPAASAIGQPLDRFLPERFRQAHHQHIENFGRTGVTSRSMQSPGNLVGLRANGEEFPIEATISQVEAEGQRIYTVILRDITERKHAEERLREQATLLDHAQDGILVRDLEDRILFWNKGAETIYGWTAEEVMGRDVHELFYTEDSVQFDHAKQSVLDHGEWLGELRQKTKMGRDIIAEGRWSLVRDDNGNPKAIFVINTDVTEKKRLESQFLRAQRMESIGTLAGGIAHDLNNMLAPILMSIQLLQSRFTDADSQRLLGTLRKSAERSGALVKQVLEFARGVEGAKIILQPRHVIKEVMRILNETLPKSIEVKFEIPDDLWVVAGDATQLHQVLMNLCVNARDAMIDGGKLTIGAENAVIDESYARMNIDSRPGRFVSITVTDTGAGIPASVLDKIFEPFFTTKEHGKGTGLGLSTVLGIVKGHGGFVNVYSEPQKGTEFRIYIPAAGSANSKESDDHLAELPHGNGELILVVDDEGAIREIARRTLETYGYSVLTAADGTEAVALYAQHKEKVEVVLTDMMMPYMDGSATIRVLHKMNPHVRIIATSGLKDTTRTSESPNLGVKTFLQKPYTAERLLKTIADVLAGEDRRGLEK
jgi:PAS domain S-box-containing protein